MSVVFEPGDEFTLKYKISSFNIMLNFQLAFLFPPLNKSYYNCNKNEH